MRKILCGKNSPNWIGNEAGYQAIHQWLRLNYGNPKICQVSGEHKHTRYEWANLNGGMRFKRDIKHYVRLCKPCHIRFDYGLIGIKINGKIYLRPYRWRNSACIRWDKTREKWIVGFQNKSLGRFHSYAEALRVRKRAILGFKQEIIEI
jgi:hypothetical protein